MKPFRFVNLHQSIKWIKNICIFVFITDSNGKVSGLQKIWSCSAIMINPDRFGSCMIIFLWSIIVNYNLRMIDHPPNMMDHFADHDRFRTRWLSPQNWSRFRYVPSHSIFQAKNWSRLKMTARTSLRQLICV